MSTVISAVAFRALRICRRTGRSQPAGGCKSNGNDTVVEVKVGDTVRNWNGLACS